MPPTQQYSFPILKIDEVLLCLSELSIDAVAADLNEPTPGKVEQIYSQLVELLLDERREDMVQPNFNGMTELEYPELHEQSVSTVAFLRACQRLLTTCGINDFTMEDLTKPDKKKLKRNISAVINFAKFREERLNTYVEFTQETDALEEKKKQLQAENERLVTEWTEASKKKAHEQPEEERLVAENKKREVVVRDLWNEQTKVQEECRVFKSQLHEVQDEIRETKYKLLNAKEEVEQLSLQIVADPKKLKAEVHALSEAKKAEASALKQLESKLFSTSKEHEAVEIADRHMDEVIVIQAECEAQASRLRGARDSVAQLDERHSRDKAEMSELLHSIRSAAQRNQRKREQMERQLEQHNSRQALAEEELAAWKRKLEASNSERSQHERLVEDSAGAVREVKDLLLKAILAHEAEKARIVQQQRQLASQVRCSQDLYAAVFLCTISPC